MITVSSPAKIHLMGEHAVVYGKPALLAAINRRLTVTVSEGSHGIQIVSDEPDRYIRHIVSLVLEKFRITKEPNMKLTIRSEIPAGYHLGSSAAVAVSTIGAVSYFLKKVWNPELINTLAFEAEKQKHGNPSGGDNTIVTFGGIVWYRRELDFLKSIWQLPFKPAQILDHFSLIDTGRPTESTGDMVACVRSQYIAHRLRFEKLFNENEEQTKRIAGALKTGNEKMLIDAIQKGQRTLEGMGVVSTKVMKIIRAVERSGGAAKILGGGGAKDGTGYVLCYAYNLQKGSLPITLGEEGVRLDEK